MKLTGIIVVKSALELLSYFKYLCCRERTKKSLTAALANCKLHINHLMTYYTLSTSEQNWLLSVQCSFYILKNIQIYVPEKNNIFIAKLCTAYSVSILMLTNNSRVSSYSATFMPIVSTTILRSKCATILKICEQKISHDVTQQWDVIE